MGPQDIINNSVASGFLVEALLTFFWCLSYSWPQYTEKQHLVWELLP